MRILDEDNNKAIKRVLILLTQEEATEMRDDLERMLQKNISNEHTHINDMEYEHEMTISIYNDQVQSFNERVKNLIAKDE